jgi:hypothetical protein
MTPEERIERLRKALEAIRDEARELGFGASRGDDRNHSYVSHRHGLYVEEPPHPLRSHFATLYRRAAGALVVDDHAKEQADG